MLISFMIGLLFPWILNMTRMKRRISVAIILGTIISLSTIGLGFLSFPFLVFYCIGRGDQYICTFSAFVDAISQPERFCILLQWWVEPILSDQCRSYSDALPLHFLTFSVILLPNVLAAFLGIQACEIIKRVQERKEGQFWPLSVLLLPSPRA